MDARMAEEDDYMSSAFLAVDTRPGLVFDKRVARKRKIEEETKRRLKETKKKPVKQIEKEKREEGLVKEIGSDNKGYALLEKMGYVKGMGLGKDGGGRAQPVAVKIKTDRGGVGRESEAKKRATLKARLTSALAETKVKVDEMNRGDFLRRMSSRYSDVEIERDVEKSQRACWELDQAKNLSHVEEWYWPASVTGRDEKEDYEKSAEPELAQQLEDITDYIRDKHCYCIWCGIQYKDVEDMDQSCPGKSKDIHD